MKHHHHRLTCSPRCQVSKDNVLTLHLHRIVTPLRCCGYVRTEPPTLSPRPHSRRAIGNSYVLFFSLFWHSYSHLFNSKSYFLPTDVRSFLDQYSSTEKPHQNRLFVIRSIFVYFIFLAASFFFFLKNVFAYFFVRVLLRPP